MRYQLNRENQILTVLDDEDNTVLHEHYVKDSNNEAWISIDDNTKALFQTMIDRGLDVRFDPRNDRYGYFNLDGDDPSPRKPKRDRKHKGIGRKSRDLPDDLLDREIAEYKNRLAGKIQYHNANPLTEQQQANLERRLVELKEMSVRRSDFKSYQSESDYYRSSCRTIALNLEKAIDSGDNQAAESYWNVLSGAMAYVQKAHDQHHELYGMDPSTKEFVDCNEFGEWSEPDRSKMPADHLEPYIRRKRSFRNPAKRYVTTEDRCSKDGLKDHTIALAASKRFMEFSQRIEKKMESLPLLNGFLKATKEAMEEKAWDNLNYVMPSVDNRQSRMVDRLGFNGLHEFASSLLAFRKEYLEPSHMNIYGNRNILLSGIESAYDRYGLRRCAPTDTELKLREFRQKRHGGTDLSHQIEHLL